MNSWQVHIVLVWLARPIPLSCLVILSITKQERGNLSITKQERGMGLASQTNIVPV